MASSVRSYALQRVGSCASFNINTVLGLYYRNLKSIDASFKILIEKNSQNKDNYYIYCSLRGLFLSFNEKLLKMM